MANSSPFLLLDNEIQDLVTKMASVKVHRTNKTSVSKNEIFGQLSRLHCPFTWKSINELDCPRNVMDTIEEKLECIEDEAEEFTAWTMCVWNFILCYEYACKGMFESAFEKQRECSVVVEHATSSTFPIPVMGVALKHVSDACKVFLLIKSKLCDKAIEILHNIIEVEDMNCKERAAIWGVSGAFYMEYGLIGMKESVTVMKKALALDSKCGEWHFLLGKALSRVRRIESRYCFPNEEELEALEKAVSVSNNTFYMVLLAQSYLDTARQIIWYKRVPSYLISLCPNVHTDWKSFKNKLHKKAFELYKKVYENSKENPNVLGRCAFGFAKLPHPFKDMKLAIDSIQRSLEKNSSSTFLNQTAGVLYKMKNENDKAKYYFACAAEGGSLSASIELLYLKQKENKLYDPTPDMERLIDRFKMNYRKEKLLGLLGAFYYFVRNDFHTALKYWQQLIDGNMNSTHLKALENHWRGAPNPCNISETIIKEILKRLKSCSEKERTIYDNVLVKFKKHDPKLVDKIQGTYDERSQHVLRCGEQRKVSRYTGSNVSSNVGGNFSRAHLTSENDWRKKSDK